MRAESVQGWAILALARRLAVIMHRGVERARYADIDREQRLSRQKVGDHTHVSGRIFRGTAIERPGCCKSFHGSNWRISAMAIVPSIDPERLHELKLASCRRKPKNCLTL
jgi:hypothetical protein